MTTPTAMAAPHCSDPQAPDQGAEIKRKARILARQVRARCQPADSEAICQTAWTVLQSLLPTSGAVIAGYWPMGDEVDIRPLLRQLQAAGYEVVLPRTPPAGLPLSFHLWQPDHPLQPGRHGTAYPDGPERTPHILLLPLLAFDRHGTRLGYGGGYYDRTLAELPGRISIGCAYAAQEVSVLPVGPFDKPCDWIVTEHETFACGQRPPPLSPG